MKKKKTLGSIMRKKVKDGDCGSAFQKEGGLSEERRRQGVNMPSKRYANPSVREKKKKKKARARYREATKTIQG